MPRRDPLAILNNARQASLAYARRSNNTAVKAMLQRAQADLNRRLRQVPASDKSFTATQMRVTLRQINDVMQTVKPAFQRDLVQGTDAVAGNAAQATVDYIGAAERRFAGIAGEGLSINTAQVFDQAVSGARASVLRRILTDPNNPGQPGVMDRYGDGVVGYFEQTLQTSMVAGTPWDDVRQQLIEGSPFLQQSPLFWAERIVRTEYMGAHNQASYNAMAEINDQTGGQLLRILCATFDDRTGADSYAVHGQIRRMNEPFQSWFGQYMTPPNRPNDREVVVPHHQEWPIPAMLAQKSDGQVASRWRQEGRKGSPPGRPLMTTVPLETIGVATSGQ